MIGANTFRVVVESPRGSSVKLKFDSAVGVMTVSRPLTLGFVYPCDWGFVPGTRAADGDPLDVAVVWDTPTFPGVVVPCRALGVIHVDQRKPGGTGRQRNDRVVALPIKSPRFDHWRSARDVPARIRKELEQFFVAVTALEDKDTRVLGWGGRRQAIRVIKQHQLRE